MAGAGNGVNAGSTVSVCAAGSAGKAGKDGSQQGVRGKDRAVAIRRAQDKLSINGGMVRLVQHERGRGGAGAVSVRARR